MQFDRSPDDIGDEIQRGWNKEDFDMGAQSQPGTVPQIGGAYQAGPQPPQVPGNMAPPPQAPQDLPPVPMSDEALLQGGSQQVELAEQQQSVPQIDQAPPMNFPNNVQPGAMNMRDGAQWDTPQAQPTTVPDQAPQQSAPQQDGTWRTAVNQYLPDWVQLNENEVPRPDAPPPSVLNPTPEAIEAEDQQNRAVAELDRVNAAGAVMNPQTDGAAVNTAQREALEEKLAALQSTPEGATVAGANVPQFPTPKVHEQAGDAWAMPTVPEELGEISTGIDSGDINLDPNFGADPRGKDQRADRTPRVVKPVVADAVNNANTAADNAGDDPAPETNSTTLEAAGKNAGPKVIEQASGSIKDAFGDLFDKKELVRMAIVFAGAMATGASPGRALAIAGQGYLQRIDAKEATHSKRVHEYIKGGKHTAASIAAFKESGDPSALMPIGVAPEFSGNFKEMYDKKTGRPITVQEAKVGKTTILVDGNGKQVNGYNYTDDASRSPGHADNTKRIQEEGANYGDTFKELQDFEIEANKDSDYPGRSTGLAPKTTGINIAKWAISNGVPPEGMGQIITNAYEAAKRDGKKATSIIPYLNEQYIQTNIGDPTNFKMADGKAVEAQKTNQWLTSIGNVARSVNPDKFGNASNTELSQFVLGSDASKKWTDFDEETKNTWAKQGKSAGLSGYMYYIQTQLAP